MTRCVKLVGLRGGQLEQMSWSDAEALADSLRLSLVEVGAGVFKLVDVGKQKYLKKKASASLRRAVKKRVEIKSNIGRRDLDTKLTSIKKFVDKGFKVSVVAKFLKAATAPNAFCEFVSKLARALTALNTAVVGPTSTEFGDSVFGVG